MACPHIALILFYYFFSSPKFIMTLVVCSTVSQDGSFTILIILISTYYSITVDQIVFE